MQHYFTMSKQLMVINGGQHEGTLALDMLALSDGMGTVRQQKGNLQHNLKTQLLGQVLSCEYQCRQDL